MKKTIPLVWAEKAEDASRIAKIALNNSGRRLAYELKDKLMANILRKYEEDFEVQYAEYHPSLGTLLAVRLVGRIRLHLPLSHLPIELQEKIPSALKTPSQIYKPKRGKLYFTKGVAA